MAFVKHKWKYLFIVGYNVEAVGAISQCFCRVFLSLCVSKGNNRGSQLIKNEIGVSLKVYRPIRQQKL